MDVTLCKYCGQSHGTDNICRNVSRRAFCFFGVGILASGALSFPLAQPRLKVILISEQLLQDASIDINEFLFGTEGDLFWT